MRRRAGIGLAIGLAAAVLAWLLGSLPLFQEFENQSYDLRVRLMSRASEARPDIAVVEIDETSLRALAPFFGQWPWPRFVHTGVIEFLARGGARVIAYDVLFTEHDARESFTVQQTSFTGPGSDDALVRSVKQAGDVVLVGEATYEGSTSDAAATAVSHTGFEARPTLRPPFEELAQAAFGIGHNFFVRDDDGIMRRVRPFVEVNGRLVPSLGMAAALAALRMPPEQTTLAPDGRSMRIGSVSLPLSSMPIPGTGQPSKQLLIDFHGNPKSSTPPYATYSFADILKADDDLSSGKTPDISPSVFKDKIVFVGTSAAGLGDVHQTPFGGAGVGGAQIHAAVADNVLSARAMRRAPVVVDVAVLIGAGAAAGVLATSLVVGWGVPAVLALMAVTAAAVAAAIRVPIWLDAVRPILAMAIALFGGVAWHYFVEDREKRKMKGLFGRYVSKDVFEHLVRNPSLARLGGQRREMTVLFSDIRGFTTASEKSTPEAVVLQLNEYFTDMVDILFKHQGTLDKFVGDMVMGLFGAPVDDPRHADHAVETAIEMVAGLARLNQKWAAEGKAPLDIGIGINSGEMIAGNIGSSAIMSYTVIGDAVNLGSRLESLNKNYGTHILISEATRNLLTIDVPTRRVDEVVVKGKTKAVVVYEVLARTKS